MNRLLILITYACCLIACTANAQDELTQLLDKDSKKDMKEYTMLSLEGKRSVIHFIPDYSKNILKISCLKDTITIYDYWGAPVETFWQGRKFLQLKYEVRGGSNLALGNTLILCVSGNKLYEALHVLRYSDCESAFLIKKYNVDFSLNTSGGRYVLTGTIKNKVESGDEPETNYHFTNRTDLQFDDKLRVFYSIKENLNDTLNVSYPNLTYKREIQGNFPKVLLGYEEYFFIGNQWFEFNRNFLTKY